MSGGVLLPIIIVVHALIAILATVLLRQVFAQLRRTYLPGGQYISTILANVLSLQPQLRRYLSFEGARAEVLYSYRQAEYLQVVLEGLQGANLAAWQIQRFVGVLRLLLLVLFISQPLLMLLVLIVSVVVQLMCLWVVWGDLDYFTEAADLAAPLPALALRELGVLGWLLPPVIGFFRL